MTAHLWLRDPYSRSSYCSRCRLTVADNVLEDGDLSHWYEACRYTSDAVIVLPETVEVRAPVMCVVGIVGWGVIA